MSRNLPKKESDLFKSVVKFYESKQYKKGIKAADNILRKFPNHGETLAMKGLTLNFMGKRDEAHEFVRKGLRNDMRSHVCWHVFGLLHRSDRNYNEAIKAYKQALRIDPENLQILRDLSLLQIQMRDLKGFVVTRHTILTLKPNNKIHWLAFALAKHLNNDREGAISIIDIYLGTLTENSPELHRGFESSELAMYRNSILTEIPGAERRALLHLEECKNLVVDITSWWHSKAMCHLKLGEFKEAKQCFVALFQRGETENYRVHNGYICCVLELEGSNLNLSLTGTDTVSTIVSLTTDQKELLLSTYQIELKPMLPDSAVVRRMVLTFLTGDKLRTALDEYCRTLLSKGVPSLGPDLKYLFLQETDQKKLILLKDPVEIKMHFIFKMLVELIDSYIISLSSNNSFPNEEEKESPSTILWSWYLRAYMHGLIGEYSLGLELLDKCLEHTPTAVDVYELKARFLKLSGDVNAAANCLDTGRELDKQDRYINNKTTKYMLQSDREDDARDKISLFTRHEGNPEQNLFDMQCIWYELELAKCYARNNKFGKSLKKYMAIVKHFEDFHEDQFDFHSYCIRKVTLRSYIHVLRFEDDLWSQKMYRLAAEGIITNYLHLFEYPDSIEQTSKPDYSNMTPSEKKKSQGFNEKKKEKK